MMNKSQRHLLGANQVRPGTCAWCRNRSVLNVQHESRGFTKHYHSWCWADMCLYMGKPDGIVSRRSPQGWVVVHEEQRRPQWRRR